MTSLLSARWFCRTQTASAVSAECLISIMGLCPLHIHPNSRVPEQGFFGPRSGPPSTFALHSIIAKLCDIDHLHMYPTHTLPFTRRRILNFRFSTKRNYSRPIVGASQIM